MDPDEVFSALANPTRRTLLELLLERPRAAGALAGEFTLSRPAISEHLAILRRAELVTETVTGREHHYSLNAGTLTAVDDWLHPFERYWRDRLTALSDSFEEPEQP